VAKPWKNKRRTVTLMTFPLRVDVVTSQAIIPAARPTSEPPTQPALLAFFQVMQRAIGQTAEPRMTPMNVYNADQHMVRGTKKKLT
jgi:hypothetical protein